MTSRKRIDCREDLSRDCILLNEEWFVFEAGGPIPESRIEGLVEGYGCETGCTGYVMYVVSPDGSQTPADSNFYFVRTEALDAAEELSKRLNLPVVMRADWDR